MLFRSVSLLLLTSGPAHAETIDVYDNNGGRVDEYAARWAAYGSQGVSVRIVGPCQSACTVLLGQLFAFCEFQDRPEVQSVQK